MNLIKSNIFLIVLFSVLVVIMTSCLVVKRDDTIQNDAVSLYVFSPKPEIPMSEELVRSKKGDMIAFLPKDWFFVDVEEKASSDIFAVAVNPEYTLSAVFTNFRINELNKDVITKEGLLGLARLSLEKHSRKSGGAIKQVGKYSTIKMGNMGYAQFEYINGSSTPTVKVAVFISNQNECYEYALVPLTFKKTQFPAKNDIDIIFRSIMATIQY